MHPIELLRAVARARGWDDTELATEAAWGLGELAGTDGAALLPACRRLIESQPGCGALWWVCARVLAAGDPVEEAYRVAQELLDDPTESVLTEAMHSAPGRVVRHGGIANLASASVAVVRANALSPLPEGGMVVDGDAAAIIADARELDVEVWVEAGVGRVLPPRLWAALRRSVEGARASGARRASRWVFEGIDGVALVVGPGGATRVEDLVVEGFPDVPELVHAAGAPARPASGRR